MGGLVSFAEILCSVRSMEYGYTYLRSGVRWVGEDGRLW